MFPQLPASVRIFVCTKSTDMRKSFDGLLGMIHERRELESRVSH